MAKNNAKLQTKIISGKVFWASVIEPNTTYEPAWQVDVCLTPATKKIVEGDGLTVKNKGDDRGDFITLKRKVLRQDGTKRQAPVVKDSQNNPWNGQLIGNGSVCNIKYTPYEWSRSGKSGVSADLTAIQVVDFVGYTKDDFEAVDGYTIDSDREVVNL